MSGEASEKLALDAIRAHAFSHVCPSGKTGAVVPIAAIKEILATFEAETRKEERERCAKVADEWGERSTTPGEPTIWHAIGRNVGDDIRNLGEG